MSFSAVASPTVSYSSHSFSCSSSRGRSRRRESICVPKRQLATHRSSWIEMGLLQNEALGRPTPAPKDMAGAQGLGTEATIVVLWRGKRLILEVPHRLSQPRTFGGCCNSRYLGTLLWDFEWPVPAATISLSRDNSRICSIKALVEQFIGRRQTIGTGDAMRTRWSCNSDSASVVDIAKTAFLNAMASRSDCRYITAAIRYQPDDISNSRRLHPRFARSSAPETAQTRHSPHRAVILWLGISWALVRLVEW